MSGEIGKLMKDKKIDEANEIKAEIAKMAEEITELEKTQEELAKEIKERMLVIPNIMDPSVPIGKDDSVFRHKVTSAEVVADFVGCATL